MLPRLPRGTGGLRTAATGSSWRPAYERVEHVICQSIFFTTSLIIISRLLQDFAKIDPISSYHDSSIPEPVVLAGEVRTPDPGTPRLVLGRSAKSIDSSGRCGHTEPEPDVGRGADHRKGSELPGFAWKIQGPYVELKTPYAWITEMVGNAPAFVHLQSSVFEPRECDFCPPPAVWEDTLPLIRLDHR